MRLSAFLQMAITFCLDMLFGQIGRPHVWFVFGPAMFLSSWIGGCVAGVYDHRTISDSRQGVLRHAATSQRVGR